VLRRCVGYIGGKILAGPIRSNARGRDKMTTIIKLSTLVLLLLVCDNAAAETTVFNFACNGNNTVGLSGAPEPMNNVSLVLNLAKKTVSFAGFVTQIDHENDNLVAFVGGDNRVFPFVMGSLDCITGALSAISNATAGAKNT